MVTLTTDTISITNLNNETFTFPQGMISSVRPSWETGVDPLKMPVSGPMNNIGADIDGVAKTITISGQFTNTDTTVITKSGSTIDLRSMILMKYWFEAILSGSQRPLAFICPYDLYSASSSFGTTIFTDPVSSASVTINATFLPTTVYIIGFSVDIQEADVEKIPFTLTLWVAGI